MPKCMNCGNTKSFGVSSVFPASPTANGPSSGLWADFDESGQLVEVMSNRSEVEQRDILTENPKSVIDLCMNCGSRDIKW